VAQPARKAVLAEKPTRRKRETSFMVKVREKKRRKSARNPNARTPGKSQNPTFRSAQIEPL
jgi:hypothetical protein